VKYAFSLVLGSLFAVFPAQGATIFVTTVTQRITGGADCSLQEAIGAANAESSQIKTYDTHAAPITVATQCVAGSGADTISLPTGGVFQLQSIVNDADNPAGPTATPIITSDITIEANGATLQWTGTGRARLFTVGSTGHLTIRNAYIKGFTTKGGDGADGGGGGMGAGGAIYVMNGQLTVDSSTFDSNVAAGGNGSAYFTDAGGGGGGLAGNGSAPAQTETLIGGGGGGGSRGNGDSGRLTVPFSYGGGGGGTVTNADGSVLFSAWAPEVTAKMGAQAVAAVVAAARLDLRDALAAATADVEAMAAVVGAAGTQRVAAMTAVSAVAAAPPRIMPRFGPRAAMPASAVAVGPAIRSSAGRDTVIVSIWEEATLRRWEATPITPTEEAGLDLAAPSLATAVP